MGGLTSASILGLRKKIILQVHPNLDLDFGFDVDFVYRARLLQLNTKTENLLMTFIKMMMPKKRKEPTHPPLYFRSGMHARVHTSA